jgi:hypothetical protein
VDFGGDGRHADIVKCCEGFLPGSARGDHVQLPRRLFLTRCARGHIQ